MSSVPYIDSFMKSGLLANVLTAYYKRSTNVKSDAFIDGAGRAGSSIVF